MPVSSPFILGDVSGMLRRKLGWNDERIGLALLALRLTASIIDPGPRGDDDQKLAEEGLGDWAAALGRVEPQV